MSEKSWSERVAHLIRLAIGCLLTDAERSAVRTNAAHRTDRLPLGGDVHGNRDPRADACRF